MLLLLAVAWSLAATTGRAEGACIPSAQLPAPAPGDEPGAVNSDFAAVAARVRATRGQIEPALLKDLVKAGQDAQFRVIVELAEQAELTSAASTPTQQQVEWVVSRLQATAAQAQAGLLAFLSAQRAAGHPVQFRAFWITDAILVEADAATVWAVAARPEVRFLREDRMLRWVDPQTADPASPQPGPDPQIQWNISRIGADRAWTAFGLDGAGVTVAIMDTGVDWQHPVLMAKYRGYKAGGLVGHAGNWICTTDEGYLYPVDGNGHGTHVTGTAVGGNDENGVAIGVAPGARWIAAKMLDDEGYGYESWIHAAFEWVIAPAGDPSLAPDVVSGSWGSWNDADEAFRPDLEALRAAGILPVFSAGNGGPAQSTLNSPGSYPEALAVGAVDEEDAAASFSSRGPSPWGETKPEVAAPGTQIRSALPGGTYGLMNGTSMATPHVTGVAAILLQAVPDALPDEIEAIIEQTARPLGDQVPNNDTGWGRIDAYQAAAVASGAGFVAGAVSQTPDLQPVVGAEISAYDHLGEQLARATSDQVGHYRLALPPATYDLEVDAFGYAPLRFDGVQVRQGETVTLDVGLASLPSGVLQGLVQDGATGEPVAARITLPGTPAGTLSDPVTGEYVLVLPKGTYDMEVARNGYRRYTTSGIEIVAGQVTQADAGLTKAPALLLVDSGAWYYGSQAGYLEQALDDRAYVYDKWTIRQVQSDVPALEDMAPYDVILWSSPLDAPGLIGAGEVISTYLTGGGNLFLTGQDIGYWDGGLDFVYQKYYTNLLKAEALADDAGRGDVVGVAGDLLEGLTLPINGSDGAKNQYAPDAIGLLDRRDAAFLARYAGEWHAGLRASGCQSYRVIYLAAGLEGLGDRLSRAEVTDRALGWLGGPLPATGIELSPSTQAQVWLGQQVITYTVELRNVGRASDRFALELSPSAWPASLWDGGFTRPLTQSVELQACETQTLGIAVAVPPGVHWNTSDTLTLTARSLADPASMAQASFHSKAPAPVLLVDDHRWYGQLQRYEAALEAVGVPYDLWRIDPAPTPDAHSPSLERLKHYCSVVWFTGFDWYATLTAGDEQRLAAYLEQGGRVLLSSEDYLYTSGFTSFAVDYLGVAGYTEALSSTQVIGAQGNPAARGLGPFDLVHPFPNSSDALRPAPGAQPAWWGQHGQPAAITKQGASWKTAFFGFALESMQPDNMALALGKALGWLSPLGDSRMATDRSVSAPGETVAYTLGIRNSGPRALSVALSNEVPDSTSYVAGSLTGPAVYDPDMQGFTWSGALGAGEVVTIEYRLQLDAWLPPGTLIRNVAHLEDESGLATDATTEIRVSAADLSASVERASRAIALPGQVLTYTLTLRNDGLAPAPAYVLDPTPAFATYLPGSAWASSGALTPTMDSLAWRGEVFPQQPVTIVHAVRANPNAAGRYVLNRAVVDDGWGVILRLEAATWIESRLFLPLALRER